MKKNGGTQDPSGYDVKQSSRKRADQERGFAWLIKEEYLEARLKESKAESDQESFEKGVSKEGDALGADTSQSKKFHPFFDTYKEKEGDYGNSGFFRKGSRRNIGNEKNGGEKNLNEDRRHTRKPPANHSIDHMFEVAQYHSASGGYQTKGKWSTEIGGINRR